MNATLTKASTTQNENTTSGRIFFLDLGGGRVRCSSWSCWASKPRGRWRRGER